MTRKSKGDGCGQKRSYASREEALAFTATKERHLRPYECGVCGKWHMTSMNLTYWLVNRKKSVIAATAHKAGPSPITEESS